MHDLQADYCYFLAYIKGLCLHAMLELVIMKHPPITTWPREATILGPNNGLGFTGKKEGK